MKCYKCGGELKKVVTDMPFKISDLSVVIIKNMPVLQCSNCNEFLIEDKTMEKFDEILSGIKENTELEILRFAS